MTIQYVEKFKVNGVSCGIDDKLDIWYGGCKISHGKDMFDARNLLHMYLFNHLSAQVAGEEQNLAKSKAAQRRLGSDPFYLARFLDE